MPTEAPVNFHYDFSLLPEYLETLFTELRLAVVYGGRSDQDDAVIYKTHNPRASKTYEPVAREIQKTLQQIGFQHVFAFADDMTLPENLKRAGVHLVWLNTGGTQGYNPVCHTPAILEMLGIPYVGHNPLNASTLDNKHSFKRELQGFGIKTSPFITWHPARGVLKPTINSRFFAAFGDYQGPFVVKPVSGRASIHVHFVENLEELPHSVAEVYAATLNTVLIEMYLPGREYCVSVCGPVTCASGKFSKTTRPFAFSTLERVLDDGELIFTSMDQKAITQDRATLLTDQEKPLKQELMQLAQQVYWDFNLRTLVRIDIRADANGVLHVLEANPKPDLKRPTSEATSLVAMGLPEHGMSYEDLILGLLADRLDYLFTHTPEMVPHIVELLT